MLKKGKVVLDKPQPDQLNCMICLNFLVHPVLMKCNHIACEYCLDEYALKELVKIEDFFIEFSSSLVIFKVLHVSRFIRHAQCVRRR